MTRLSALTGVLAAAFAATALADDPKPAAPAAAAAPPPALTTLGEGKPLTADALGEQRAKAKLEIDKVTINAPTQNGIVAGNTAINTQTGGNSIGGTAFSGAAGLVNSIQNTGNNVLIQSSTIVNVSVAP